MTRELSVSDGPHFGVTYDRHSDDPRGVTYAPKALNLAPREHL
jgi:hypothetical protein